MERELKKVEKRSRERCEGTVVAVVSGLWRVGSVGRSCSRRGAVLT